MIDRVPSWLSVFVVTLVAVFRLTPTLAFLGPSSFLCESSPSTLFATRSTKSRDDSTAEIVLPNRTQSSNFWYSVVRKDSEDVGKIPKLPVVRHLDKDGHLPPGAYRQFGREQYETKQTCALSIAVDLFWPFGGELVDSNEVVSGMQKFIDSGLTSFHLGLPSQSAAPKPKSQSANRRGEEVSETIELLCPSILQTWGEENIFGRLQRSIPASVMKSCHLVIPLMTPSRKAHANHVTKSLVRQAVTESIGRIGTDSIDTLQLQCK